MLYQPSRFHSFLHLWCLILGWCVSGQNIALSAHCSISRRPTDRTGSSLLQFGASLTISTTTKKQTPLRQVYDQQTKLNKERQEERIRQVYGQQPKSLLTQRALLVEHESHYDQRVCENVQDNYPSTEWEGMWFCNQSVAQGLFNSTCKHELVLKDCDRECGLCACSTAHGLEREHCSGHGYCSADCGDYGCKNAHCICSAGWTGSKCENNIDSGHKEDQSAKAPRVPTTGQADQTQGQRKDEPFQKKRKKVPGNRASSFGALRGKDDSKLQLLSFPPASWRHRLETLRSSFQRKEQVGSIALRRVATLPASLPRVQQIDL